MQVMSVNECVKHSNKNWLCVKERKWKEGRPRGFNDLMPS